MQAGAISLLFQLEVGEEKPRIRLSLAQFQLNLPAGAELGNIFLGILVSLLPTQVKGYARKRKKMLI